MFLLYIVNTNIEKKTFVPCDRTSVRVVEVAVI